MYFNALQCHVICRCDFVKSAIHNSQFTELGSPATETALRQRINLAQEKQQVAQNPPKKKMSFFRLFFYILLLSFSFEHFQSADHCVFPSAPRPWRSLGCCPGHNSPPRCRPPGINSIGFPPNVWKIPRTWKSSTFHLENKRGLPNQRKHQLNTASARVPKSKPGGSEQQPDVFLTILWQTCHLQKGLQTLSESGTLQNKTSNFFHVRVLLSNFDRFSDFKRNARPSGIWFSAGHVAFPDGFTAEAGPWCIIYSLFIFSKLLLWYIALFVFFIYQKHDLLKTSHVNLVATFVGLAFFSIKWTLFMSIATEKFEVLTATSHLPWLFHNAENATPLVEFLHSLHGKMDRIKTEKLKTNDKWHRKNPRNPENALQLYERCFFLKGFWNHKIRQQISWISAAAPDSIAQGSGKSGAAQAWRLRPDWELVG